MNKYFTKTFFRFFFGFLAIIAVAFGVLLTSTWVLPTPVDNIATPQ
jgi:hypothetical protein